MSMLEIKNVHKSFFTYTKPRLQAGIFHRPGARKVTSELQVLREMPQEGGQAALDAWAAWCDAKGLSCNMVLDQALSASTVLDRIARCGRGSKTWAPGLLSAVWDAAGLPVEPLQLARGEAAYKSGASYARGY